MANTNGEGKKEGPAGAREDPPAKRVIELHLVGTSPHTKSESFPEKLILAGLTAFLAGVLAFGTAMWSGFSQQTISRCEIAKDILMDEQFNSATAEGGRQIIVQEAEKQLKECLVD